MIQIVCVSNEPYLTGEGLRTDGTLSNLVVGKRYRAEQLDSQPEGWLRVWDDFGEDYLYPPHMFEICPRG